MNRRSSKQVSTVQQFWNAFQACVEENRVGHDRSAFYVKWAQTFVQFLPEKRLLIRHVNRAIAGKQFHWNDRALFI
jgi:hypothetical protein